MKLPKNSKKGISDQLDNLKPTIKRFASFADKKIYRVLLVILNNGTFGISPTDNPNICYNIFGYLKNDIICKKNSVKEYQNPI
jgi:hypothetical protein